jgi:hypothetical protein
MYKRHITISNVLKPHFKWKLLLFGEVQMRDSKDQVEYENSSSFRGCHAPKSNSVLNNDLDPIEADQYDQSIADDLIAQIAPTIGEDKTSGSETSTMVVEGQTFKRVYTITWNAIPAVCLDEEGNSIETFSTTFNCSVEYVQL